MSLTAEQAASAPEPETTGHQGGEPNARFWPGLIIALLGTQVLLMLVMVYMATADRSFAVEPDYYQKSLRWDAAAAQRRASEALGWQATISVANEGDIYKRRQLTLRLTDRSGQPIDDASVDLVAFSHARGSERAELALTSSADGHYDGPLRIARAGLWEFRIVARRGEQTFVETQTLRIASSKDAR